MSNELEISVVVPVYNGENYLGDCLASIAAAVEKLEPAMRDRVEVVVCDNHSTDASREIAKSFEFRCQSRAVSPPQHEENRTRNWAYGLGQAKGRWLMMLHHDDLLAEGGLAAQLSQITGPGLEKVVIVAGRHRMFSDPGKPSRLRPVMHAKGIVPGRTFQERSLAFHCSFVPFILFRREAYEAVEGLDSHWQLVQDWELWMRLLDSGDLLFHGEEVGWWRVHGTSPGYRSLNAREHVELARNLERSMPAISANARRRAYAMALDRAALQLAEVEQANTEWLEGTMLPDPSVARRRHTRSIRRIGVELAFLRLYGAARFRAAAAKAAAGLNTQASSPR